MDDRSSNPENELRLLFEALAESAVEMPAEELRKEVAESGHEIDVLAEEVRSTLLDKVNRYKQRHLEQARLEYVERREAMKGIASRLPKLAGERRQLLSRVFKQETEYREAFLTLQHRDFRSLEDEDVTGYLEQLADLGVLDGYLERGDE